MRILSSTNFDWICDIFSSGTQSRCYQLQQRRALVTVAVINYNSGVLRAPSLLSATTATCSGHRRLSATTATCSGPRRCHQLQQRRPPVTVAVISDNSDVLWSPSLLSATTATCSGHRRCYQPQQRRAPVTVAVISDNSDVLRSPSLLSATTAACSGHRRCYQRQQRRAPVTINLC